MFFTIQSTSEFLLLLAGMAVFCVVTWRRFYLGLGLILFLAPTYIFKIYIGKLPLTVLEISILTALLIWLLKKISAKQFPRALKSFKENKELWLPLLLILAGAFVSTLLSLDIEASAGIFKSWFLEPAVFALMLLDIIQNESQIKKILLLLVSSGVVQAAIGLGYWFFGRLTFDGRLAAFYLSPNHLAMALAPCFLASLFFWFEPLKKMYQLLLFIVDCLLLIVLYLTFSYAAWLGIFAALFAVLVFLWQAKIISNRRILGVCVLLLIVCLALVYSQIGSEKLNNLLNSDRSSWQSRLMVWRSALKIGWDNWFFGVGPGMFQKYYLDYQKYFPPYLEWAVPQPQNIFLAFWLQTGLVGLIGFFWLIINFFRRVLRLLKKQKPSYAKASEGREPLALALMAVMIYILVHGLLDATFWKNDLALIFLTIAALGYKAVRLSDS